MLEELKAGPLKRVPKGDPPNMFPPKGDGRDKAPLKGVPANGSRDVCPNGVWKKGSSNGERVNGVFAKKGSFWNAVWGSPNMELKSWKGSVKTNCGPRGPKLEPGPKWALKKGSLGKGTPAAPNGSLAASPVGPRVVSGWSVGGGQTLYLSYNWVDGRG